MNVHYEGESTKGKEHWHTNDQFLLARHPFYRIATNKRLEFFSQCLRDYTQEIPLKKSDFLKILDAGCGDGVVLNKLDSQRDCRIIGCEYNFTRAQKASSVSPRVVVVNADLAACPFKENSFHIIIMNQVLEHIKEDELILNNINKILRDDGKLIIGVPNEGCLMGRLRNRFFQPWILKQTDHVHFYIKNEISQKLERAKFDILSLRRDGFMFPYSKLGDFLSSFRLGFNLLSFLGRILKSQCGGLYFVCKKNTSG